jgi:lipopolysaccharide export system permease protein
MLFHSAFQKDLSRSFGATLVVISTIVMTNVLIRTLGQATVGSVNPSEVMLVMGFTVLGQLTSILTLSLFIAIVATLSRMYADSEMIIWFSSGQGLYSFLKPIFSFSWLILLIIAILAMEVWPWSNRQTKDLENRYEQRNDIERIAPGQFQESAGGKRVFFIDKDTPDNRTGTNVFVSSVEGDIHNITSARQGKIDIQKGERVLNLNFGQQVMQNMRTGEVRIIEFKDYQVVIDPDVKTSSINGPNMYSTMELIREPTLKNQAELAWRMGLALAAVNLLILGLAVSTANPRVGRSYHTALALLIFMIYYNMINVGQSWVSSGKVSFASLMLGLHGGVFFLALLWITIRHANLSWRHLLPVKRPPHEGLT